MINVHELERRWNRYKIKSYIPHATIVVSILVIFTLVFSLFTSKEDIVIPPQEIQKELVSVQERTSLAKTGHEENLSVKSEKTEAVAQESVVEKKETQQVEPAKVYAQVKVPSKEKIYLTPSLNFMKNINSEAFPYYENDPSAEEDTLSESESNSNEKTITPEKKIVAEAEQERQVPEIKKTSINIKRQDTQEDIRHVIKRFKKSHNPALSLFVAKKYYELGDYHKSYNYALMTNEINNNIEASWIIFAKSLVKLNEKEMAIKTLTQYIDHSNSHQAKLLLDEIRSGKFK
ncbi:CDC27 family protein [bacterium]|nr:CDC27 family protein [bacterium]MBU1990926.1 CDC27 family protein [bacterium]